MCLFFLSLSRTYTTKGFLAKKPYIFCCCLLSDQCIGGETNHLWSPIRLYILLTHYLSRLNNGKVGIVLTSTEKALKKCNIDGWSSLLYYILLLPPCHSIFLWHGWVVAARRCQQQYGAMPTSGICVCHYSRAVVAAALLLQIVPIGTYTMSRGTSILGEVRNVEISGATQQLLLKMF